MTCELRWWTNGLVLVLAGLACARTPLDEPQSTKASAARLRGVFVPTGSMTVGRLDHTATRLQSGRVLVAGGANGVPIGSNAFASAEVFDPGAEKFTETVGSMSAPRFSHKAALLGNGQVLVAGGFQSGNSAEPPTLDLYSPSAGKFISLACRPGNWAFPTGATLLGSGKVLITGITDYQ